MYKILCLGHVRKHKIYCSRKGSFSISLQEEIKLLTMINKFRKKMYINVNPRSNCDSILDSKTNRKCTNEYHLKVGVALKSLS